MEITITGGARASGAVDFSFHGLGGGSLNFGAPLIDFPAYTGPNGDYTTHGFSFADPELTAVTLPGGQSSSKILFDGNDTLQLGSGAATVNAASDAPGDHILILGGPASPTATGFDGFSLVFGNGVGSSTVTSGGGNYLIYGGAGGGVFHGGTDDGNVIAAGTGAASVFGGGGGIFSDGLWDAGSGGRDLIVSGTGPSTIYARGSDTLVGSDTLTSGATGDQFYTAASTIAGVPNTGTIVLGAGVDTVVANGDESEDVVASALSKGLLFWGGAAPSTVHGYDGGSVTVSAGTGGGVYAGGVAAGNLLYGDQAVGSAAVTLFGGGGNDTLVGAAARGNLLVASNGNETLVGGAGNDTFNFAAEAFSPGGDATVASTYTLERLNVSDSFAFNTGAIASQGVVGGSYTIDLVDGSRIILAGVTDPGRSFG